MSFRRFVGKLVRVTTLDSGQGPVTYTAKLSSYDDSGIWIERRERVQLPDGELSDYDGLLFLPLTQVASVFASEQLSDADDASRAAKLAAALPAPSGGAL